MKEEQSKPSKIFQNYVKEMMQRGEETGGYEMEIKYYNSLAIHSDINNNMAHESFDDNIKYGKSLTKTRSLLEDKTGRLHDHEDVNEYKHAVRFLQDERDREDNLMAKMVWYQDKLHKCHGRIYENESDEDVPSELKLREELQSLVLQDKYEYESSEDDTPDSNRKEEFKTPVVQDIGAVFGGGKSILPEIKRQKHSRIASHDRVKKDSPRPLRLRPVLPSIAVAKKTTLDGGQVSSPADSKKVTTPTLLDKIRSVLPSIGTTQKSISDNGHIPSPPPIPQPTKKRWSFFKRK